MLPFSIIHSIRKWLNFILTMFLWLWFYDLKCVSSIAGTEISTELHVSNFTGFQPNGQSPVSSTDKPITSKFRIDGTTASAFPAPRRLTTEEIPQIVQDHRIAARNAIEAGNA